MAKTKKIGMVYNPATGLKVVEYTDSYKFISDSVGGYIERIPVTMFDEEHIDMWCNENGKLIPLDPSVALYYKNKLYDIVMGNVVFTRSNKSGSTLTLTDNNIAKIKNEFEYNALWVFTKDNRALVCLNVD